MDFGGGGNPPDSVWEAGPVNLFARAAANQAELSIPMPTVGSWLSKHWYVILVIGLMLVACIVALVFSLIRWKKRVRNRHEREIKKKGNMVSGFQRVASTLSSVAGNDEGGSNSSRSNLGPDLKKDGASSRSINGTATTGTAGGSSRSGHRRR